MAPVAITLFIGVAGQKNSFFGYQGSDNLTGSTKADSYHFNRGDGTDVIYESGGTDRIVFGEGISADDIRIAHRGDSFRVCLLDETGKETADAITLTNARTLNSARVEILEFSDGSTQTLQALLDKQVAVYGTQYNDTVYGSRGDDHLLGLTGNDTLYGRCR